MSRVLFGRDPDLQALSALLAAHPLVTIVGPAGVGKTALASRMREIEARGARRAVHPVELAALSDSDQVVPALVRVLQLPVSRASALEVVQAALRDGPHLLVLDNCEHLLPAVADVVSALMAGAPDLGVLATSQEALSLNEERVYRLGAL